MDNTYLFSKHEINEKFVLTPDGLETTSVSTIRTFYASVAMN